MRERRDQGRVARFVQERVRSAGGAHAEVQSDREIRCGRCGTRMPKPEAFEELLTIDDIMERYKVKRTKAVALRREVRQLQPDAVRSHGKCVRVVASALDRLWTRG